MPAAPSLPDFPDVWERRQRKAALEQWVAEATTMKQEYLAKIETITARVNKTFAREKNEVDEWYRKKQEELDVSYREKTDGAKRRYREQTGELQRFSDTFITKVEEKMKVAKDEIDDLIRPLDEHQGRGPDPMSLLRCPITKNIMVDPVMASDGRTYERSVIGRIFSDTPSGQVVISPVTNEPMTHRHLVPNTSIQAMVAQYLNAP
mmetsp:Transcript_7286/g.16546  ORF Transcript_7286/g.16546 Transcript_7286/m.16546 type:complete len:206 (+) Transcript_7286:1-618(+)